MFEFFDAVGAFFNTILAVLENVFKGLVDLVNLLAAVPVFFANLYLLPSVLMAAVMLTVNVALLYMIIGRNAGG